jgi:hypothetical protein
MDVDQTTAAGDSASKDKMTERLQKKFEQTQRPITENITQLSEQLTLEKIAAIKAKKKAQQRKQVTAGVDDVDDELMAGGGGRGVVASAGAATVLGGVGGGIGAVNLSNEQIRHNEQIMKQIAVCEIVGKDRFNVLQSTGKHFEKGLFFSRFKNRIR